MQDGSNGDGSGASGRQFARRTVLRGVGVVAGGAALGGASRAERRGRSLRIDGRGYERAARYEFATDGRVEPLADVDDHDTIGGNGSAANGAVGNWYDEYRVFGAVTAFTMAGRAEVTFDGERVDPRTLGDGSDAAVLRIDGRRHGGTARYEFAADGRVKPLGSVDDGDDAGGSGASGTVGRGYDDYRITGSVTRFSHDGGVDVTLDGAAVDPDELSGSAGGGSRTDARLRKLGQATLVRSQPGAGFAEAQVRPDGRYAVVGTKFGGSGTHLLDLRDPSNPREVHRLPSDGFPNPDVKFGRRAGLYYRSVQGVGFDVVDYGYRDGTPADPAIVASIGGRSVHNVTPHPNAPVVYTVNYDDDGGTPGFDVWDVSDPAAPRRLRSVGRSGACHDVTVDARRGLLHAAYMGHEFDGYVAFDASNPRRPTERGAFSYAGRTPYPATGVDEEGFGSGHHAQADPRRDLVVVGDERSYGVPGGKHVLDVGWGEGSLSNPRSVGFVTSPNARRMRVDPDGDGGTEATRRWDWTGHDFDFVPRGDRTLLVSGDWHEGVVLYDVTDPAGPRAVDRYATADRAGGVTPNATLSKYGDPPWAWNAEYCPAADLVVACDQFTGVYTFEVRG